MPEFKKDTAFLPSTFSGKVKKRKLKHTEKLRTPENTLQGRNDGRLMPGARRRPPCRSVRRPCRHRTHWAWRAIGDTGFLCSGIIRLSLLFKSQFSNLNSIFWSSAVWCLTVSPRIPWLSYAYWVALKRRNIHSSRLVFWIKSFS